MKRLLGLIVILMLLAGCASHPSVRYDPYEPYNRAMFTFNDTADRAVVKPLATAYKQVTPAPVRTGVGNFFGNLQDVYSAFFNLLRWEPAKTANDVMRVMVNTSFGLFGLIDVATQAGLENNKTALGDTFAAWGWKDSNYLVLPLLGPSTVRDGLGSGVGLALSEPETEIYHNTAEAAAFYGVYGVNKRAVYLGADNLLGIASVDPYSYMRDTYMQLRAQELGVSEQIQEEDSVDLDELLDSPSPEAEANPHSTKEEASSPESKSGPNGSDQTIPTTEAN